MLHAQLLKLEGSGDCIGGWWRSESIGVGIDGGWMDWRLDKSAVGVARVG